MVSAKLIQFCPDTHGTCAGEVCAAFQKVMGITLPDGNLFVKKVCEGTSLPFPLPMVFTLDVNFCSKYEGFVDENSLELFEKFTQEFNLEGEKLELREELEDENDE